MHRHLCDAVDFLWLRQSGSFQDSWCDVRAVSELVTQSAFVLDALWPANDHRVTNAAEMRSHLFSPFEWGVPRPCPCCCVMRIHVRSAPFFEATVSLNGF